MNAQTRTVILAAARARFSAQGYHATRVSQIVGDAGMAQGSFYNYFPNKRAIFAELLAAVGAEVCACVEAVAIDDVRDRETYAQVGLKIAQALTAYFFEHREQARIFLWDSVGLDREADAAVTATYARIAEYSAAYVRRGQALGIVRTELVPEIVAHGLVGMCAHLAKTWLAGRLAHVDLERLVATVLGAHLHGILTRC